MALTVWIIYTVDHLLDAKKVKTSASTPRHRFHQQHFNVLSRVVVLGVVANAVIVFFLRESVFYGGIVLALIVTAYLFVHRFVRFPKEFFIATLYTGGVLLPAIAMTVESMHEWPWIIIIQFALIALLNLVIFSWYDVANDRRDGNTSFVTLIGEKRSSLFIWTLLVINFILSVFSAPTGATVTITVMNTVLLIIFAGTPFFSKDDRYRLIGDAIFFIPLIYVLL